PGTAFSVPRKMRRGPKDEGRPRAGPSVQPPRTGAVRANSVTFDPTRGDPRQPFPVVGTERQGGPQITHLHGVKQIRITKLWVFALAKGDDPPNRGSSRRWRQAVNPALQAETRMAACAQRPLTQSAGPFVGSIWVLWA